MTANIKCDRCGHFHVGDPCVCTLINCDCPPLDAAKYKPQVKTVYHQQVLAGLKEMDEKIEYMLKEVPGFRNTDDWAFITNYWHYNLGFCTGMMFTGEVYARIRTEANPESIRRCRQKVCQNELAPLLDLQAMLKDLKLTSQKTGQDCRLEIMQVQKRMHEHIAECELIPTDAKLLANKGIKMEAFTEYALTQ